MNISEKGIQLIIDHESLRLKAYDDLQPDVDITSQEMLLGTLTIGYGHTKNVFIGQTISKAEAELLLEEDLATVEKYLNQEYEEITQSEYDALASFIFNTGIGNYEKSTLKKRVEDLISLRKDIEFQFSRWKFSKGIALKGLVKRRKDEANLFLE